MMLLVTAFEPFDETGINSSLETLREIERRNPSLATAVLPVRFGADVAAWRATAEQFQPDALLLLGQSSRSKVEIERIAINLKKDNSEKHQIIVPDAPPAYFTTWPIEELLQQWHARRLPGADSPHAGTFLCNHIFFHALHDAALKKRNLPIAFVHLPKLPDQIARGSRVMKDCLPLEILVGCVQIAVDQIMALPQN